MAVTYGDRVQETFTTTGTGTISLGGALTGYQAFSTTVADTGTCYYMATDSTNWEVGLGTYAVSGNTLARTTVMSSSNGGAAVNWAAGTKTISLVLPASIISTFTSNPALKSHITGCYPVGIAGNTSTNATLSLNSGQATDSTGAVTLNFSSANNWSVTNGNAVDGYQGGTTLPNSSTIHFYVIAKSTDTTWTHSFASTSLSPSLPATYTYYRRMFSMTTNSSGALNYAGGQAVEVEGGSLTIYMDTAKTDIAVTNLGAANTSYTLTVPTGKVMKPLFRCNTPTNGSSILLFSGQESPVAPSAYAATGFTATPGADLMASTGTTDVAPIKGDGELLTNTSGQISAYANASSTALYFVTRGYRDFRRT